MFYGSMRFFIHSYPGVILEFSFFTGLTEKLYKILQALSVFFFEMLAVSLISLVTHCDFVSACVQKIVYFCTR
ncbi:hypothetical protein B4918_32920 (plasmid) [Bacillus thuringiensis]|uniref:Uncharacterized protein n=1 Tax=Bacillus thuringiensis TaxID=1428 RepID=A0A9W3XMK7_BACTU|nr:hypothetical protein B4918_32920 [Bacillus thuringiensis]